MPAVVGEKIHAGSFGHVEQLLCNSDTHPISESACSPGKTQDVTPGTIYQGFCHHLWDEQMP